MNPAKHYAKLRRKEKARDLNSKMMMEEISGLEPELIEEGYVVRDVESKLYLFGGIYYIKAPKDCGDLVMLNPVNTHQHYIDPRSLENFNEFDVCTGQLLTVKSFLKNLKKIYEASFGLSNTSLVFGAIPYREGEIMTVEVNNQNLLDLGWVPKTKLEDGLINIIKECA